MFFIEKSDQNMTSTHLKTASLFEESSKPSKEKSCFKRVESQAQKELQRLRLKNTQQRMGDMFKPNQVLGRLHSIGCVAVEITQKCNLDCTLCYLSENSQSVDDIPIEEVFKRLIQVKILVEESL